MFKEGRSALLFCLFACLIIVYKSKALILAVVANVRGIIFVRLLK